MRQGGEVCRKDGECEMGRGHDPQKGVALNSIGFSSKSFSSFLLTFTKTSTLLFGKIVNKNNRYLVR